jgi:hypothetical protein
MLRAVKNPLKFLCLTLFLAVLGVAPVHAAPAKAGKNRLVIQVNEDDAKKWNAVLGNLHNISAELAKEGVAITVVAIGPGLGMLTADSLVANRVQDAQAEGVRFVACANSMQALQIAKDDLVTGIDIAKAGYVEIMRLQQRGWTYLRP